jgi:ribulose 1,5-bisphosphate synthetase/thiazole synthase
MQFTITLDTDNTLIDNLNAIEDSLRVQGIMSNTDNLVAITDNPLHSDSITLRDDVVLTAVGNQISVLPNADVTIDSAFEHSINSSMLDADSKDNTEES